MTDFAAVLATAKRPETVVLLCLAGDLVAEYETLEREHGNASTVAPSLGETSPAQQLAERMDGLREQMATAEVAFRLRAISARDWSDFHDRRPQIAEKKDAQTDDEYAIIRAEWRANWYRWCAELVSRSSADPVMSVEQVDQLVDCLSGNQWDTLTGAAYGVNATQQSIPFSLRGSAATRNSAPR